MKYMTLICLLFTFDSFAETCLSEIKFVGGKNNISPSCFDLAPESSVYHHRILEDEKLELKVWDRIIFIKNLKTGFLTRIAGGKTQLFKVRSIDFDRKNKLIYVLNENDAGDLALLSYKGSWQGNIFPFKSMDKAHLPQDVKQVIFDESTDRLLGLANDGKIIYLLAPGESRHSNPKKKPKMEKSFTAKTPIKYMHSESTGLYLLYENMEWKKFDGVKDKKLLKSGKLKELKAPLKIGTL
jgi:hypothetical protein